MNKLLLVPLLTFTACGMNKSDEKSEGFQFRQMKKEQEKQERDVLSFIPQYRHHDPSPRIYSHNFTLKDNQILHISSEHELVMNHDRENNRIDITVKVRKESK